MASGSEAVNLDVHEVKTANRAQELKKEKPARRRKTVLVSTFGFIVYPGGEPCQQLCPSPLGTDPDTISTADREAADDCYGDEFDEDTYDDFCVSNWKRGSQFCRSTSRNKPSKLKTEGHCAHRLKAGVKRKVEQGRANVANNRLAEKSNIDAKLSERGVRRLGLEMYYRRVPKTDTARKAAGASSSKGRHRHAPSQRHKEDHPSTLQYTLHEDTILDGCKDVTRLLIDIQHREITPEDYELLLRLDDSVAPKTVPTSILCSMQVVTVDVAAVVGQLCSICMELYHTSQMVKTLPCNHTFHADCIDHWLTGSSHNCPLDGLAVAS